MPNRMIKESICTSETLAQLTPDEERLFYRLLVNADDFGRFDGRAAVVLAACFPLQLDRITVNDVEVWLQKLASVDLIRFYEVGGRRYLYFPTWDKHQRKRAQHSKYPAPPSDDRHVTVTCPSRDGHATDTCCSRNEKRESRNEKRETTDETRARAREGELWSSFRQHFTQAFGGLPNKTHFDEVDGFITDGMELAAVVEAVRLAALNKARGWGYVRRIVQNWLKDGLYTLEDIRAHQERTGEPRASPSGDTLSWIDAELERLRREMEAESA